ncbi:MAG: hypothetical protein LBT64_02655, partial [Puniceicoccales bacterium]|nr:hypothetical protein [Puniceicoccales bacterium]
SIPQEKIVATDDEGKGYTAKELAQALSGNNPLNSPHYTDAAATFIGKYSSTILNIFDGDSKHLCCGIADVGLLITALAYHISMEEAGVPSDTAMDVLDVALGHLIENLKCGKNWDRACKFCKKEVRYNAINIIAATKGLDASTAGATMKECEKNYSAISEHNKSFFSTEDAILQWTKTADAALSYAKEHGDNAGRALAKVARDVYTQCYDIGYSNGMDLNSARTCALKGITGFLCEVNDGKDINEAEKDALSYALQLVHGAPNDSKKSADTYANSMANGNVTLDLDATEFAESTELNSMEHENAITVEDITYANSMKDGNVAPNPDAGDATESAETAESTELNSMEHENAGAVEDASAHGVKIPAKNANSPTHAVAQKYMVDDERVDSKDTQTAGVAAKSKHSKRLSPAQKSIANKIKSNKQRRISLYLSPYLNGGKALAEYKNIMKERKEKIYETYAKRNNFSQPKSKPPQPKLAKNR